MHISITSMASFNCLEDHLPIATKQIILVVLASFAFLACLGEMLSLF